MTEALRRARAAHHIAEQFHRTAKLLDVVREGGSVEFAPIPLVSNYLQALELAFKSLILLSRDERTDGQAIREDDPGALFRQLPEGVQSFLQMRLARVGEADMFAEHEALGAELSKLNSAYVNLRRAHDTGDKVEVNLTLLKAASAATLQYATEELAARGKAGRQAPQ